MRQAGSGEELTVPRRQQVLLPDIGDFDEVDVVEVLVSVGDRVEREQSLIVLESDKAAMEIPSPVAGVVEELALKVGDKAGEGALVAVIAVEDSEAGPEADSPPAAAEPAAPKPEPAPAPPAPSAPPLAGTPNAMAEVLGGEAPEQRAARVHASPSVRRLARELGVNLALTPGSGRKGRITKEDVQQFVKASLAQRSGGGVPIAGVHVAAPPEINFSRYGETEQTPLNRVRKLSAANLHRSWVTVPHVTQFDEADITELDGFRREQKALAAARGVKLTFLPFVVKAVCAALHEFPHFNASLDATGENLILKRYHHIGVAVDTPNGLVVPVIRDADQKGLFQLASELEALSEKARTRQLRPADIQGGSFSISSLGGIGGTFFTPIVNHPEVAILGVSRMDWKPAWRGGAWQPRLVLPLSLSYDHRVIDGADAVRFTGRLAEFLCDLRRLLL
ncbi:MAG: dihydrolipoyllysine-residue acetyltransferase [Deltaproteobacteria bacterium]|nr:dihydrolipoyllysine-residue acetyltransferase [Deltaproteobacteria bacterium]